MFGSKNKGEPIESLADTETPFVYFASIQDLRGSAVIGGKFDKNEFIFLIDWDFVVIDEAHEGTQTKLGKKVIEAIMEDYSASKRPKVLELSGTPFNLLDKFKEGEIYTWDYIMEQRAKKEWPIKHFGDSNPYEELPQLEIFTYDLDKSIPGFLDVADGAFNFREFFRTWTGDINKDFKPVPNGVQIGDFVHKNDVFALLNLITKTDNNSNYPFATEEYRSYYRHTLWMVPGVKEAKALSKLLQIHPVFGSGMFNIVNVAGDGDEEQDSRDALKAVQDAIGHNPDDHYSITLSCGRLTTGVTVPEWTAVFMLAGSFSTSASNYLQTIFRVQTPANINGRIKERCSVFDFAPDRTLKMVAEAGQLSSRVGKVNNDRIMMGEFLNYCPVISLDGSSMQKFNIDKLLQQLKKAYTDRVVRNGFDDKHLYNDYLFKLNDIELKDFDDLKATIGASKPSKKNKEAPINEQGFTDEEYEEIARVEKRPKKERSPEDEEKKRKQDNAKKAMLILRGISIRIPFLIYGASIPVDQDITADNFVKLIDDASWNEFMPNGVTKEVFKKFSKYYEQDVFIAAGRAIRNIALAADELSPMERVQKIAEQFATFKNPDKETVLTPWRVVNMHMSECLGGWCFFNDEFTETIEEPRFVDHGEVTAETFANVDAKILEINSKTGLYPLYVTYSIFRKRLDSIPVEQRTIDKQYDLWIKTVEENIFVICKTPMAKAITKRTLLGYRNGKINAHAFDDLINQLKEKPQQFRDKVLRGNTWGKKESVMKFNAVVGNPPYQTMDGGAQASATPIYNYFIQGATSLFPKYISMIMPSRWFAGGKGLDDFRDKMLKDDRIFELVDFPVSTEVFSNVEIKGGICYFAWDKDHSGNCEVITKRNGKTSVMYRALLEDGTKSFIRYNEAVNIYKKVSSATYSSFSDLISSSKPFGLRTFVTGHSKFEKGDIVFYANKSKAYIAKKDIKVNLDWVSKWKVLISYAYGAGEDFPHQIINKPFIAEPNSACSETYLVIGPFESSETSLNVTKYLYSKFLRFMVLLLKNTQHATKTVYEFVPMQDFTGTSDIDWSQSVADIDKQLYAKYNLDETEIAFIESMIKPM